MKRDSTEQGGASIAQTMRGADRLPGADARDAAESLQTRINGVRCLLQVMADLTESTVMQVSCGLRRSEVTISADAFSVVMEELANRCKAIGDEVIDLGYGR